VSTYTYDALGRLTKEAESAGTATNTNKTYTYTYDARDNRATLAVTGAETYSVAYAYDLNNRLLTETRTGTGAGTTSYTYDSNGNELSRTGNGASTYNGFNQLITSNGASYVYKPDGMRRSKTVSGTTTTHIWDGSNIAIDNAGTAFTDHVHQYLHISKAVSM
jgi:YD repeat-containing protein